MKHKSVDILTAIAVTLVAAALALVPLVDNMPVRLLVLPLVFVLPGYTLTCAIFTKRVFGIAEQIVFSLGLSLVLVILGGLLLNSTPFGLQTGSWIVFLCSITLITSAITLLRRSRQNNSAIEWWKETKNAGFTFRQGLLLVLSLIVLSGGVAVSVIGAAQQPYPGFTQFWISPSSRSSPQTAVRLGVSNMELAPMEYNLDVSVNGRLVKSWSSIHLKLHENWETTLVLPTVRQQGAMKVEAMLYRADTPAKVYRHVLLWLRT